MTARAFDIALFGATGFTGRLTAEYLLKHAGGLRVALAGRSLEKLKAVQASLGELAAKCELVVADAADGAAVQSLAARAKVVCTTVGPYVKYGWPLVEACAKAGTHYADITGEVQFMRESIDRYQHLAVQSGARIVHSCGFDSIPSDLGMLMLHEAAKQAGLSGQFTKATTAVENLKGGFSGGTVGSMLVMLDEMKRDRSLARKLADPYALSPSREDEPDLGRQHDLTSMVYDDFLKAWTAPFVMASVNTRVVRRSNSLLGHAYGRELRYREVTKLRKGARAKLYGATLTAGMGLGLAALSWAPTRRLLEKRLPQAGEGPSAEARAAGGFRFRITAETETGRRFSSVVVGTSDPGYGETAKMLGESVLCLARDEGQKRTGMLTPATAFGLVLVERLRQAGMTFMVE